MKYLFVRRYNPLYDIFLIKYFKEGGIEFDENLTFQDVEPRWLLAMDKQGSSAHEKLFCDYVSSWRLFPESRPTFDHLLARAMTGSPRLQLELLRKLESDLPPGKGKLVFTKQEVATEITNFYRRHVGDPLRRDMDKDSTARELMNYFSEKETASLPDIRIVGRTELEKATRKVAGQVLRWIDEITPDKISRDIEYVLDQHDNSGKHMHLDENMLRDTGNKVEHCSHHSDYVELNVYHNVDTDEISMAITPSRGFGLGGEGWQLVIFPWYDVFAE